MIHKVTVQNRHLYKSQLDQMFRLRCVHFVEERGWSGMRVENGKEMDDWDDDRMVYLLALDEHGDVLVSMRARPTDDKCIVADVFPQLVHADSLPVKGKDIWEISRIFMVKRMRNRAGLRLRDKVFLASVELAVAAGATRLVGIIDTFLLAQATRFPWRLRPLGLPQPYPEGEMIGVGIPVSREELLRMREAIGVEGSVLEEYGPLTPAARQALEAELLLLEEVSRLTADRGLTPHMREQVCEILKVVLAQADRATEEQLVAMVDREEHLRVLGGVMQ
jgi:acyl-homoserine lactone synthase